MPVRFRHSFRLAPGIRLNVVRWGLFRFRCRIRLAPGIRWNIGQWGLLRFRHSFRLAPGIRLNVVRWGLFRFRCGIRLAPGIRWNIGQWRLLRFRSSFHLAPGIWLILGRRGPFRYRHSFRLAPGIRLNIGKQGLSTSLVGRGAHVTVGRNTRATVSASGTGLSYTASAHQRSVNVVTVVIWGAQLLGAAAMMALLFLWAAGWPLLQASAPEADGGRARGAGDRHSADLASNT